MGHPALAAPAPEQPAPRRLLHACPKRPQRLATGHCRPDTSHTAAAHGPQLCTGTSQERRPEQRQTELASRLPTAERKEVCGLAEEGTGPRTG